MLRGKVDGTIGEFSSKVDGVQQPILVEIIKGLELADKTENQEDINNVRKLIPINLPIEWRGSYSSALDKVQEKVVNKTIGAIEAIEKAKISKNKEDIKKANVTNDKLNEVISKNKEIKEILNNIPEKLTVGVNEEEPFKVINDAIHEIGMKSGRVDVWFNDQDQKFLNSVRDDEFVTVGFNPKVKVKGVKRIRVGIGSTYDGFNLNKNRNVEVILVENIEEYKAVESFKEGIKANENNTSELLNLCKEAGLKLDALENYAQEKNRDKNQFIRDFLVNRIRDVAFKNIEQIEKYMDEYVRTYKVQDKIKNPIIKVDNLDTIEEELDITDKINEIVSLDELDMDYFNTWIYDGFSYRDGHLYVSKEQFKKGISIPMKIDEESYEKLDNHDNRAPHVYIRFDINYKGETVEENKSVENEKAEVIKENN